MLLPTQSMGLPASTSDHAPADSPPEPSKPPARATLRGTMTNVLLLGTIPIAAATVVSFLPLGWFADLFTNFRVQYVAVLAITLFAVRSRRGTAAGVPILLAANLTAFPMAFGGPARVPVSETDLIISTANVLSENDDPAPFLEWVDDLDPDIVAVLEFTPWWADALTPLRREYPYTLEEPRWDNFGVAVFSRVPLEAELASFSDAAVPSIVALTESGLTLIVTHSVPPIGREYAYDRDQQLASLGRYAAGDSRTVIVGDFNATPFSRPFRDMLRAGGLRRAGGGLNATWPAHFPPLWIALDHAVLGADVELVDFEVGPKIGSDHHPITVRVR